ncbi:MAG: DUF438 domain-containing protein [Planctomycetes bacterium]|nr:DUF438 domain-containing protein [Planctomycetota bacterium]
MPIPEENPKNPAGGDPGADPVAAIEFATGRLTPAEIAGILNTIPAELSFVGSDDTVRFYSEPPGDRLFPRTKAVIGRNVRNCHPPKSVHMVEKIIDAFRKGERDVAAFWIPFQGRFVHIRYFAVRDEGRNYLGVLEVAQDVTEIRALEGERRLLDWEG